MVTVPEARFLTQAQLDGMLREVLTQHLAKLDRVAAVAKLAPGFDRLQAEREDRRAAWVYRLLDAHGPNAHVSDADQAAILADGLDQKDVEFIIDHLARLQDGGFVPTKAHILRPLLEKQGFRRKDGNQFRAGAAGLLPRHDASPCSSPTVAIAA